MLVFFTGIMMSVLHVLGGPDHLAAVSPLAIANNKQSLKIGFFWGIGHTLGVFILGLIFFFFRNLLPIDTISLYSEKVVGLSIILIGGWVIFKQLRISKNSGHKHFNPHTIIPVITLIGIIHGLAGFSHIVGVLPTLSFPTNFEAILYLTGFAIGTIVTMFGYAFTIGFISKKISTKSRWHVTFCIILGCISVVIGLFWIIY